MNGSGTELDPYLIATAEDLVNVAMENNANPEQHYEQIADIDLTGIDWQPIGDVMSGPPFQGSFNGRAFEIRNLTCEATTAPNFGFFGVCVGATLTDIKIVNPNLRFGENRPSTLGVLASVLDNSNVTRCSVSGGVIGSGNDAGFAFTIASNSIIKECFVSGVELVDSYYTSLFACEVKGGSRLIDCYANGKLTTSREAVNNVTGFVMKLQDASEIENCLSVADMTDFNKANKQVYKSISLFVERGEDFDGTILNSYADSSSVNPGYEMWVGALGTPEARTTEQLKDINNYVGWDFENVWKMVDGQVLLKSMPVPVPTAPSIPTLQSDFFTKIGGKWFRLVNQNS